MKDKPVRITLGIIGVTCFIFALALQMGIGHNVAYGSEYSEYRQEQAQKKLLLAQEKQVRSLKKIISIQETQNKILKEMAADLKKIKVRKRCIIQ